MRTQAIRERENGIADPADVIYARRAIRSYQADVVDEVRIRALLDAAVHAPTAMHQEPWRFVVVQNRAILKRISDRAKEMVLNEAAHHGDLLKTHEVPAHAIASLLADPAFNIFYDASTLIIIGAVPANDFVSADCWLAAENLMLAACADGLGTCVIGFAVGALNTPDIKSELGIPDDIRVFAPIIVGVERGDAPSTPRKAAVVVNWIR